MLEWYRLGNGLDAIIGDALHCVAAMLQRPAVARDAERLEYAAAMHRFAGVDVLQADCRALWRAAGGDESLWQSIGSDRGSWLDLLLSQRVVPALAADRLTVLRHFPAEQAALARLCPRDARFADRFELFFGTIELANGYVELLDADELRCRTDADMKTRRASGKPLPETDTALIAAMTAGMPACAGVALGLDRLLMIAAGCDDIRDVMTFPL
jgi:lysyl-tRNA synthetase class 2